MAEHNYAQVLRWIADGKSIQFKTCTGAWADEHHEHTLTRCANGCTGFEYRIKPRTMWINGREIEAPLATAPESDSMYWVPGAFGVDYSRWNDGALDAKALAEGRVFSSKKAAQAAFDAITSLLVHQPTE